MSNADYPHELKKQVDQCFGERGGDPLAVANLRAAASLYATAVIGSARDHAAARDLIVGLHSLTRNAVGASYVPNFKYDFQA